MFLLTSTLVSQNISNEVYLTILNEQISEQDTVLVAIVNPTKHRYFLPIDFKHKGYYTNKFWTYEYQESPRLELMPEDSLEYELTKHLFVSREIIRPIFFKPHFIESFYPNIEVRDSLSNIAVIHYELSTPVEPYTHYEPYFERDTTNFFSSVYDFTLLEPKSTTYIKLLFNTVIRSTRNFTVFYYLDPKNKYNVTIGYKVNNCETLEKRIPLAILKKLDKQGYKCYDKKLKSTNSVPLILNSE